MTAGREQYRKDQIGNVRFEFFTEHGSISLEAWSSTKVCRISTFRNGLARRTEVKLSDDDWWKLIVPISYSGFWHWLKRYDSEVSQRYPPSWSFSVVTSTGWYFSSGDGGFPPDFGELLEGMSRFATMIESTVSEPPSVYLAGYFGESVT